MVKLTVNGEAMHFLVDSGAEVCLIREARVQKYASQEVRGICSLEGTPLTTVGTA